ncbi:MAG: MBL fold metallo-hydrolase [Sarcina sp.]
MKIKILGSGGCISLPRATCFCKVCEEAREKGEPYKRTGCSLFIKDINILIDTPEDINYQLNREKIKKVLGIFYSHWDPDHSMGMRILEQLQEGWRYGKPKIPVEVLGIPEVIEDIKAIENKFSSYIGYYKEKGLCEIKKGNNFDFGEIKIKLFPVKSNITSTIFKISQGKNKILYAPCDVKPFPLEKEFIDSDILIIGNFMPREAKYTEYITALYYLDEIIEIAENLRIKKVIITHIEEQWELSYDDYKKIESKYNGYIEFAYDSMNIEI